MSKIFLHSLLLVLGMALSVAVDLTPIEGIITTLTMVCVAYIMIEVGLEFTIDKKHPFSYVKDYLIAATAAGFPWIFCALYFIFVFNTPWAEALLIGRFAAPTSAGILFTMLAAAGLGTTWLFKKARILAIFDDLDTILFMIPLQILIVGFRWEVFVVIPIIIALLYIAYRFLHRLPLSSSVPALFFYGVIITALAELLHLSTNVQLEILLPAFVFGSILRPSKEVEHQTIEPRSKEWKVLDLGIKAIFMFLVGASLPPLNFQGNSLWTLTLHLIALAILMNLGKMFPSLCYRNEASKRERLALSVAMFPRGEVGAGVLLVTLSYGIENFAVSLSALALALNLLLTGVFIWIVVRLIPQPKS